jgi:hypothetical protein
MVFDAPSAGLTSEMAMASLDFEDPIITYVSHICRGGVIAA